MLTADWGTQIKLSMWAVPTPCLPPTPLLYLLGTGCTKFTSYYFQIRLFYTGEGLCCNACYVHIEVCHGRVFPQLWPPATETLLLGALQHRDTVSRSAARADVSSLCFTGLTWAETAQEWVCVIGQDWPGPHGGVAESLVKKKSQRGKKERRCLGVEEGWSLPTIFTAAVLSLHWCNL